METTLVGHKDNGASSPQDVWYAFVQSQLAKVWSVTSRDPADCVAGARQAIDQELAAMHLVICSLRACRDAPIVSCLPPEALLRLFRLGDDDDPQNSDSQRHLSACVQSRIADIWDTASRNQPDRTSDINQAVDQEVAAIHMAMCSLRTHRNGIAPISRLPLDILPQVFFFLNEETTSFVPGLRLGWIRLTHVYRYWRDFALQQPRLWASPALGLGHKWLRLMLSRSETAPLHPWIILKDMLPKSHLAEIHDMIAEHMSHTAHLRLGGAVSNVMPVFEKLTLPTDCLEALTLEVTGQDDNRQRVLPDRLGALFPQLYRVELVDVPIDWSSPILCGLTHLMLDFENPDGNGRWRDSESHSSDVVAVYELFFSALERMPALEVLLLTNALPSREGDPRKNHKVALSHLKDLGLQDETARCFDIMKQLKFPSSCSLRLACNGSIGVERIADILPLLRDHSRDGSKPHPTTFQLLVEKDCFHLTMGRNVGLMLEPLQEHAEIDISIPHPADPAVDRAAALQALCDAFFLEQLLIILVDISSDANFQWSAQSWIQTFGGCQQVRHVYVVGEARSFIHAMATPAPRSAADLAAQPGPPNRVFLERVETVNFSNVDFERKLRFVDVDGSSMWRTLGEVILNRFAARKEVAELPAVALGPGCIMTSAVREELAKMTAVVQLDGEGKEVRDIPSS